ncbi:peptidoglycan/LPS O-acetylase OafA/YrhL [Microvirga subterranea]|uniref:Peptidoglycan/LPS O-acetylase OafA/YrhL n=2 Tax=Microvirga subterranea TaxID=186651 RepID=A0A370HJ57_9HYPH|nr:peptidoglycan/LPS O-acetylase OafA/YrhL [Microvirga subterranea]
MNGESAVLVFFVLSGFVLRLSLERIDTSEAWRTVAVFCTNRVFRLFPILIVSVVCFKLLGSVCVRIGITSFPLVTWDAVIRNSLLTDILVIGPSWSIQTELAATAVILASYFLKRHFGFVGLIIAALYTCFAIDFPLLVGRAANLWPYSLAFVLGMIVAEKDIIAGLRAKTGPSAQILFLIGFLVGRHIVVRAGVSGLIAQSVFGALLVGSLVAHKDGVLGRFLEGSVSQFLGRISYSLYLVNVLWLYFLWAVLPIPATTNTPAVIFVGLISATGAFLISVPLSWLTYQWIEVPGIWLGKRVAALFKQRAPSPVAEPV